MRRRDWPGRAFRHDAGRQNTATLINRRPPRSSAANEATISDRRAGPLTDRIGPRDRGDHGAGRTTGQDGPRTWWTTGQGGPRDRADHGTGRTTGKGGPRDRVLSLADAGSDPRSGPQRDRDGSYCDSAPGQNGLWPDRSTSRLGPPTAQQGGALMAEWRHRTTTSKGGSVSDTACVFRRLPAQFPILHRSLNSSSYSIQTALAPTAQLHPKIMGMSSI